MKSFIKKMKGKKVLSALLVLIMVLTICSPAFSPIITRAANSYPVELGFNNLFIFEEWANNKNSTTVVFGGTVAGEVVKDIPNGSFRLTKTNTTVPQAYTGHGEDKTNSINNTDYYSIAVEPNTTYCFSYNLDRNTGEAVVPFLFMFDSSFLCKVAYNAPGASQGANSFLFTTPSDVEHIQLRFTLTSPAKAEADISNISLTKCDVTLDATNLFDFNSWAESQSGKTAGISNVVFADGSVAPNTGDKSILMSVNAGGTLFTGFSLETVSGYYTIPVTGNTSYVLNYNLINTMSSSFGSITPYIVRVNSSGGIDYVEGCGASGYGKNSYAFTTAADTAYVSVVFSAGNSNTAQEWIVTLKDIELFKATEVNDNKVSPNRLLKTYGEDETYGTLPTPSYVPDGYVFAGWNTKADGSGMRITADTPVQPKSYTVYPKFEPAVDSLTVKAQPDKTIYTVGEKLDTTGLVLQATINNTNADEGATSTFNVSSGYYCTPEVLSTVGTHTITAHYGGKTATFTVTVKASDPGTVIVNGASKDVTIANNEYTFNYSTSAFNRYEVTYRSDSYVSGVATFNDGKTEEFFLEPSDNGSFGSYVDKFLDGNTYNQIVKIKFTTLDKENGEFELISLKTVAAANPGKTITFNSKNGKYEMGVSLEYGGVVSELYDLSDDIYARTYSNGSHDITLVDYKNKLDSGHKAESQKVNLINTLDRGRYLQQSYYGTGDKPYIQSEYNNAAWPYNPVQGGNVIGEASKIIDYKVTADYVYVKARPLDWAKWSDEYAATDSRYEAKWGDSYITDTYVEAWYYFQGDTIKVTNRKVDYSGLPEASHSQEFPALYLIEPLNHFVYNNVSAQDAWKTEAADLYNNSQFIDYTDATRSTHWSKTHNSGVLVNYEEPEYWGLTQKYKDKFGMQDFEPWVTVNENWAAFTASEDQDSFGVGLYTDATNKFYYGVQPTMYQQTAGDTEGSVGSVLDTPEYRHAQTTNPAPELPTSYIAPTDTAVFRSYEPTEFTYYLATGTASEIREDFRNISKAEEERAKPKIAVPETVYLQPNADGKYTDGQYYVNNVMNKNNFYQLETTTEKDFMYLGFHIEGAKKFAVNLTNVDEPDNDVIVSNKVKGGTYENIQFDFDTTGTVEFYEAVPLGLHFSGEGLDPGEIATVKWDITVTYDDGTQEVFTAYTVMYAPQRTVGAVAEARQVNASQNEVSSWITGANGIDHSQRAPLGSFKGDVHDSGYFREDPLVYGDTPPAGYNPAGGNSHDYIISSDESTLKDGGVNQTDDYSEDAYVLQTATDDHDSSRAQSYLGLLKIDESRYTNTDQIPNLRIGYDALRVGSYKKDSLGKYNTYYTVGDELAYTSSSLSDAPSGWTSYSSHTDIAETKTIPYRESFVPSYKVSDLDGKYLHAIAQGTANQTINPNQYSTAGTSVLISLTDKSTLRESVTEGYGVKDPTDEFLEKLEEAATILGDPSASQEDIDRVNDALDEYIHKFYALKYDNIFSAYEMSLYPNSMAIAGDRGTATYQNGTITVVNDTITAGEAYTSYGSGNDYYKVDLKPNTEYVFEYDVTTDVKSQAFMFFYNAKGGNSEAPTNMSIQTNGGAWQSKTESNPWFGNYGNAGTYHYVIKFTTGATTTQASFRFGNTSNDPTTSTFSNIKLIDAERYYADAEYTKTEDVYEEYAYYGTLQTPARLGYTFNGWFDAEGNEVTAIDNATEHKSIFSQWTINNYTITYNANGGSVSPTSESYTVNDTINIPTPTRDGYIFQGWTATAAEGRWELNGICLPGEVPAGMYGNVILTAQWVISEVNVTFDNLIDLSAWNKTVSADKGTMTNITSTGFTLTCSGANGELTSSSPYFTVEPGKSYKIDMDITGDNWDVYIFFCDAAGNWIDFTDGGNRYSSNGGGNQTRVFTAPNKSEVVKAQIRVDSNDINKDNPVTFNNIRVWEDTGITVSPVNKVVSGGEEYGTLPTPVRAGYKFDGWKNDAGQWVNASDIVNSDTTVNLYSQWTEIQYGINFSTNGGTGEYPTITVKYSEEFTLYDGLTASGATFLGWSTNQYSTTPDFAGGKKVTVSQLEEKGIQNDTLYAVWELNEDCVSDDTVVADFGLAITVNPFGNDTSIFGYHALGFSDNGYDIGFSTDSGNTINKKATGTYGNFSVEGLNVVYTPTKVALDVEEVTFYTKITYRDGSKKIVSNTIEIVPASNVLFEENYMNDGATGAVNWTTDGTTTNKTLTNGLEDIYGFDEVYKDSANAHSYGSAAKATVSNSAKRSVTKTFDFVGDGIDLISACGENTGIMIVKISGGDLKSPKAYIVDTYYNDDLVNENNLLCQTPIVSFKGNHGKYTVEATAAYLSSAGALKRSVIGTSSLANGKLSATTGVPVDEQEAKELLKDLGFNDLQNADLELVWFDDNSILNGGTGATANVKKTRAGETVTSLDCYLDGFRIYHPLNNDENYIEKEKNSAYINVIDGLNRNQIGSGSTSIDTFAYVIGSITDGSLSFTNYQNVGPQNELYLKSGAGDALVLMLGNVGPDSRVMLGLRAVTGEATVTIGSGTKAQTFDINSATEMYYDITDCIEVEATTGIATITIQNTGSGILAVNNIKTTGNVTATSVVGEDALEYAVAAMAAPAQRAEVVNGVVTPVIEGDTTTPDNGDDDTTTPDGGDDNTSGDNSGTTESGSFLEQLIAMIIELFMSLFNILPIGEVM